MNTRVARVVAVAGVCVLVSATTIGGQTVITPPDNKYTLEEDVELGRQAADEVQQQLPMLADEDIRSWVSSIGQRIVTSIPRDLQHPGFRYAFQVVNVRETNAFALPGGPMYLNRGMIEAARTQGEVASVIAHEISHVALRHGTAQATKATKYEIGALVGAVVGSIIGGNVGSAVSQGTQFGLGTAFLRFGREFERQADLLGSHLMAASGYDPLEMASTFKTIEKQGGRGGPQWLSDHPNPGDRYTAITREAKLLTVHDRVRDTSGFTRAQARLRQMAPAPTTEAATQKASARGPAPVPDGRLDPDRVAPPSSTYTAYTEGGLFTVRVPSNWRELPGGQAVIFAPEGAYGRADGQGTSTRSASRPASASRSTTPRPVVSSVRFSSWIEMHRRCRRVRFRTAPGNRTWDRVHC
ncbi:MAG TPA: M48 family metalloprotease [Vicinamibacterales bacterium]|nr:M48 family metalloprotease [Vicinamibacterales bacterium]